MTVEGRAPHLSASSVHLSLKGLLRNHFEGGIGRFLKDTFSLYFAQNISFCRLGADLEVHAQSRSLLPSPESRWYQQKPAHLSVLVLLLFLVVRPIISHDFVLVIRSFGLPISALVKRQILDYHHTFYPHSCSATHPPRLERPTSRHRAFDHQCHCRIPPWLSNVTCYQE